MSEQNPDPDRKAQNATSEDMAQSENTNPVGSLFWFRGPSASTLVSLTLGGLLFGGLGLVFGGGTLWALQYGIEFALVVLGTALIVLASVIAQIGARAGVV